MSSILKSLDAIMSSLTKEQYRPYLEAYKGKMKDPLSDFPNYESDFIGISDLDELDDWLYDSVPHTELGDEIFRVVETTLKKNRKNKELARNDFPSFLNKVSRELDNLYEKTERELKDRVTPSDDIKKFMTHYLTINGELILIFLQN